MYTMAEAYLLKSENLTAVISRRGGEIRSLKYRGTELIWQGDPTYWEGSAPLLFPFCGRVKAGIYRWQNDEYPMPIHGFLPTTWMFCPKIRSDHLTLTLTDSPETREIYPFSFKLTLNYRLTRSALRLTATVAAGDTGLPFSFGCHPGFNLPVNTDGFAGAHLRFHHSDSLSRIEITESGLLGNGRTDYPLTDNILPLTPDPAGGCGIFFEVPQEQRALTLTAPTLPCDIRMEYADFPVLGLWHAESAPYLCIEPWQGLPAPDGIPTDLAHKPATVYLAPGEEQTFTLHIILRQKG